MRRSVVFLVLSVVSAAALAAQSPSPVNIPALKGKTRAQLQSTFAGKAEHLDNWNGWKSVDLTFNGKRHLAGVTFTFASPVPETEAKAALAKFQVQLDQSKYFAAPVVHGYRNMTGAIRTVNLSADRQGTPFKVSSVGIFYNIGYDE